MPVPDMLRTIIESVVDTGRGGLGALVLFASGNDDRELLDYELEAVRGVITVGATTNFDEATPYSNYGASVDIVAPTGTLSTDITGADGRGSRRLHDALRRDLVGVPHRRRCGRAPGQRGAGHERRGIGGRAHPQRAPLALRHAGRHGPRRHLRLRPCPACGRPTPRARHPRAPAGRRTADAGRRAADAGRRRAN